MQKLATEKVSKSIEALLHRLDRPGPRDTSCCTADRFVAFFGAAEDRQALARCADGLPQQTPASFACPVDPSAGAVLVTPTGRYFFRTVAREFDHHGRADKRRERLSRLI